MSGSDLIAEARRLASWAPDKPESVHDVVCAGFNALAEQLAARTRDFLAAVERNEEKDRRIADLVEQFGSLQEAAQKVDSCVEGADDGPCAWCLAELHDALTSNPARGHRE